MQVMLVAHEKTTEVIFEANAIRGHFCIKSKAVHCCLVYMTKTLI